MSYQAIIEFLWPIWSAAFLEYQLYVVDLALSCNLVILIWIIESKLVVLLFGLCFKYWSDHLLQNIMDKRSHGTIEWRERSQVCAWSGQLSSGTESLSANSKVLLGAIYHVSELSTWLKTKDVISCKKTFSFKITSGYVILYVWTSLQCYPHAIKILGLDNPVFIKKHLL